MHTSSGKEEVVLGNLGSESKEKCLDNVQSSADASTSTDTSCKSVQGETA